MATRRIRDLITIASRLSTITEESIISDDRSRRVCMARFAVIMVARSYKTDLNVHLHSLTQIGAAIGGRDHNSVMNALYRGDIWRERNPAYAAYIEEVRKTAEQSEPFVTADTLRPTTTFRFDPPMPESYRKKYGSKPRHRKLVDMDEMPQDDAGRVFHAGIAKGSAGLLTALLAA